MEADVRKAYLDVEAAQSQVEVARHSIQLTQDDLKLTRQRFDAGVTDNVIVVQSQEYPTGAELDYIDRVFPHQRTLRTSASHGRSGELPRTGHGFCRSG